MDRRGFLRGLLASTAVIAAPFTTEVYSVEWSETLKWQVGITGENWRDVVRMATLPDLPGYRPCDHIDLPLGFAVQPSQWLVQWGETSSHFENSAEAS